MATYTSSKELESNQLKLYDIIQFTVKGKTLIYKVQASYLNDEQYVSNALIFEKLGITDKNSYAASKYGYIPQEGQGEFSWPEYREGDYAAATRLVHDLFLKCKGHSKEKTSKKDSLYKEGDVVVIKDTYDPGCSESDYPCGLTKRMIEKYGGEKVTIEKVLPIGSSYYKDRKFYIEDYKYTIKEDDEKYVWTAGMFKGQSEGRPITEEESYEVGDFVKIKDHDDPYHIVGFIPDMVRKYGGNWCKIRRKDGDGWFVLETLGGDEMSCKWSKFMFSAHKKKYSEINFKSSSFSFTKEDIPESCHYHPYVIDQALVEYSKGINSLIHSVEAGFKQCLSYDVFHWFNWSATSQGAEYWQYIYEHPNFTPQDYTPVYFIEETPHKPLKEEPSITLKESTSLKIPCNYEEVTLSIKKKKVHF